MRALVNRGSNQSLARFRLLVAVAVHTVGLHLPHRQAAQVVVGRFQIKAPPLQILQALGIPVEQGRTVPEPLQPVVAVVGRAPQASRELQLLEAMAVQGHPAA